VDATWVHEKKLSNCTALLQAYQKAVDLDAVKTRKKAYIPKVFLALLLLLKDVIRAHKLLFDPKCCLTCCPKREMMPIELLNEYLPQVITDVLPPERITKAQKLSKFASFILEYRLKLKVGSLTHPKLSCRSHYHPHSPCFPY
jgi:hypothetical protein